MLKSSVPTVATTSPTKKANTSINNNKVADRSIGSIDSIHSINSSASESRKRQSKRDDAIRRRIENDLNKKKKSGVASSRKRRAYQAGTVMSLKPNDPIACKTSSTVYEISQLMTAKRENCILVINESGELMGIFTAKDLAFRVVGAGLNASSVTIDQIMTPNPICAYSNQPASEALTLMVERGFRHLPVLDEENNQILGILDITKCYEQQMEKLERIHSSANQLDNALTSVHNETGIEEHPLPIYQYFETLKQKLNSPTLESVLDFSTGPVFTNVKASVYEATILMKENRTTAVLIKDTNDEVAGIFTSKDVVLRVIAAGLDPKTCSIVRVMTPHPDVANVNLPVQQALRQMLEGHYLNLPVVGQEQEIIGIVDVLRLTYVTLNQIKQVESSDVSITASQSGLDSSQGQNSSSGPAWNKFWTSFDHQHLDDNDSVHSDSISAGGRSTNKELNTAYTGSILPPPDVTPSEIHQFDIGPSDSISYTGGKSFSETRGEDGIGPTTITGTTAVPEEIDPPFTFKFKSPGIENRVNRITVRGSEARETMTTAIVGALACQKNSFLKVFNTTVISSFEFVPPATPRDKQNKNKKSSTPEVKQIEYGVELKDTILFPEGGGQPFDRGTITLPNNKEVNVKSVIRDKLKAIHITDELIEPGTEVTLKVDWNRRIDIMQQHTGQHLLSAVFDTYNLETLSWSMGDVINYIELPEKVSDEVVAEVNTKVNQLILENHEINVVTPDEHGHEVDVTHLPDDYDLSKGIIRIVKIGDLDANPCCGTHLTSTGQIQTIALLHQVGVRGGHSRLFFTCGNRVSSYLRKEHDILKDVSGSQLSCQIEEVVDKVAQLNKSYRKSNSMVSGLLKEIANMEANRLYTKFQNVDNSLGYVYRADNNPEYLTLIQKEIATLINTNKSTSVDLTSKNTLVLINGDYPSGNGGMVKVMGPKAEEIQAELKKRLSQLKGGGKGASFQGKIPKYEKGELESVLLYLDTICN
ncbi:putative alanyl-tRNA editing protein alaX [Spathaspora sp. JA1]|nr:putative alanyl-tRNA editing protein alaX [Spathaspora sp. JA1]